MPRPQTAIGWKQPRTLNRHGESLDATLPERSPGLSEKEQLSFLEQRDGWQLHDSLSLAISSPADAGLTAASAGWLLNGKAVAEEALSERTRLARDATDPAAAKRSTS